MPWPFWPPITCDSDARMFQQQFVPLHGCGLGQSCLGMHGPGAGWTVGVIGWGTEHFSHPSSCPPSGGQEDWLSADDQGSRRRWGQRHPKSGGSRGIWHLLPAGERSPEPPTPSPSPSHPGARSRVLLPLWVSRASHLGSPQDLPLSWDESGGSCQSMTLSLTAGAGGGARVPRLPDEAGTARAAPGGAGAGR